MKGLLLSAVHLYQRWLSPWLLPHCRFYPTCSEFARVAITQHGACYGSWLALKRLLRCQPLCAGGYDPVPMSHRGSVPAVEDSVAGDDPAHPQKRLQLSKDRPTPVD